MSPRRSFGICLLIALLFACSAHGQAPTGAPLPAELCNADVSENWFSTSRTDADLATSPWAGRGVLMLAGAGSPTEDAEVRGIPVGRQATGLRFVHTYQPGPALQAWKMRLALARDKLEKPPEPPVLFRYVVHYADGHSLPVHVRWGEGISDWLRVGPVPKMLWAEPVWQQKVEQPYGGRLVVYAMNWPNPYPDRAIRSVDVVSANDRKHDWGAPAVFPLTPVQQDLPGARYYVDLHGDDQASGTFDDPWRTLHRAADAVGPGDTVYLRGGRHGYSKQIILRTKGTEDAWITVSAYPGETAILDGYNHPLGESDGRAPHPQDWGFVQLLQPKYTRLQGLHVEDCRKQGINIYEGDHVDLLHNVIYQTRECGIRTYGHWWGDYRAEMTAGLTPRSGRAKNTNIRIYGNRICKPHSREMVLDRADSMLPVRHTGHEGITIAWTDGFELGFNEIYGCSKESIDCKNGNYNGRIHHNYIHHGSSAGIYLDGWGQDMQNIEIAENLIRDVGGISISSEQAGGLMQNISVHHNVVRDALTNGIGVSSRFWRKVSHKKDITVHHNTIYRCGEAAATWGWFGGGLAANGGTIRNLQIRDNIVARNKHLQIHTTEETLRDSGMQVTNNLSYPYTREPRGHSDERIGLRGESPLLEPPRFVDPGAGDFRLEPESPARGAATDGGDLGALHPDSGILHWQAGERVDETFGDPVLAMAAEGEFEPVDIPDRVFTAYPHRLGWEQAMPNFWMHMNYDLTSVPTGDRVLGGVPWRIGEWRNSPHPTIIALRGFGMQTDRQRAENIPIGRAADTIYFLHAHNPGPAVRDAEEPPTVLSYVIRYSDGGREEVAVKWGVHIEHWMRPVDGPGKAGSLPGARVAWSAYVGKVSNSVGVRELTLYCMPWTNPRPGKQIAGIDVVSHSTDDHDYGAPIVVAITTARK